MPDSSEVERLPVKEDVAGSIPARAATLDIKEFQESGLLLEVNRQFFHPLGLALAVREEGGVWTLDSIWDARDDPEGYYFPTLSEEEIARSRAIEDELRRRSSARIARLGYVVQPLRSWR